MFDATYREENGELLFFTQSVAAAKWVAMYVTTNIGDTIHFTLDRGREVVKQMQENGLLVGTQIESDAQEVAQLEVGEYDEPQDKCPRCGESEDIVNEDGPTDGRLPVTCHACGYQWTEPDVSIDEEDAES